MTSKIICPRCRNESNKLDFKSYGCQHCDYPNGPEDGEDSFIDLKEYDCGCVTADGEWFIIITRQCDFHRDDNLVLPAISMRYTPLRELRQKDMLIVDNRGGRNC